MLGILILINVNGIVFFFLDGLLVVVLESYEKKIKIKGKNS